MKADPTIEPETVETLLKDLGAEVKAGFDKVNANISLVSNEVDLVKDRIGVIEGRQSELYAWRRSNSERVRGIASQTSETDMAHDAKLAGEIVARQSLAAKVDDLDTKQDRQLLILESLQRIASNPVIKQIATAIGTAILVWLAAKGIK